MRIANHLRSIKPYTARNTKPIRKIAGFLGKYKIYPLSHYATTQNPIMLNGKPFIARLSR